MKPYIVNVDGGRRSVVICLGEYTLRQRLKLMWYLALGRRVTLSGSAIEAFKVAEATITIQERL